MKLSENTSISLPARNLLAILAAVAIGTMSYFSIIERLNKIETTLQLMEKDLEAANTFIDSVPKGGMVSPQVQELYMLVEYLGENVDKLKEQMEAEIPMILKNDMVIQFHEERLIDLEERKNGNHYGCICNTHDTKRFNNRDGAYGGTNRLFKTKTYYFS